ncbi:piriformospora indica-insensitive protein 2 [Phalaenopsis equestris]|uniref:piriformospora indica-insensitive protein 2 n=1 Tax=Phalaenopsis equestris TaxID=78828 RepID=UPI0009E361F6|nr:piriformospora indica-insensitive protein 2 [Phalaenopsis equestris]
MEFFLCPIYFLIISITFAAAGVPAAEQEAAYLALESINSAVEWRSLYPDDMCLSGPHGVVCDLFSDGAGGFTPHITELNFGYLSDFNSNAECGINATLPSLHSSSLPFLRRLFFYRCFRFGQTAISSSFWNISTCLEELVIHDNPALVGHLSALIARLVRLRRFIIYGTGISGVIPSEIGQLRNLEQLVISRSRLQGSVPATVADLQCLKLLDLSGNNFLGDILPEIGRLAELVKMDLSSNRFTGPVPAGFTHLKRLEFLDLSHNRLTGGVPVALAEMQNLKEVYLSDNPLGGRIPEIWENLGGISGLGLSNLGLTGNIPPSIGQYLQNICYLSLENNFLVGELPEQIRLLERSAKEINMENNSLHGRIPFTAGFIASIGDKLKLAGNPKLCIDEEFRTHVRSKGNLGNLLPCNKTQILHPALDSLSSASTAAFCFGFVVVLFFPSFLISFW